MMLILQVGNFFCTVKEWWMETLHKQGKSKKGILASFDVDILGNLERKERSHISKCFFNIDNDYQQIKDEVSLWS
jgi:hypothetical protein